MTYYIEIIGQFIRDANIKEMALTLEEREWNIIHKEYKEIMHDASITRLQHIVVEGCVIRLHKYSDKEI